MKRDAADIRLLKELLHITDTALAYAEKNDVANVMRCIRRRGRVLSKLRTVSAGQQESVHDCLQMILSKDSALMAELSSQKEEIGKQRDAQRAMKKLKMRFSGKGPGAPQFIDRKA